jgi:hypothetical protein
VKVLRTLFGMGAAVVAASTFGALGAPASLGCQTHACDPDFVCISSSGLMKSIAQPADAQTSECTPTTEGAPILGYSTNVVTVDAVSTNATGTASPGTLLTWDSSAITGPWLDYPPARTYIINLPQALQKGTLWSYSACVSADNPEQAGVPHMNSICGPGYLVEFLNVTAQQLTVFNASCAHYSLLIEVQVLVQPSGADDVLPDASSADSAVSPSDASDSSADAPNATDSEPAE